MSRRGASELSVRSRVDKALTTKKKIRLAKGWRRYGKGRGAKLDAAMANRLQPYHRREALEAE